MKKEPKLKNGTTVVMHSCIEADPTGKVWVCNGDSMRKSDGDEVVFLHGFSGSFSCDYLAPVNLASVAPEETLQALINTYHEKHGDRVTKFIGYAEMFGNGIPTDEMLSFEEIKEEWGNEPDWDEKGKKLLEAKEGQWVSIGAFYYVKTSEVKSKGWRYEIIADINKVNPK